MGRLIRLAVLASLLVVAACSKTATPTPTASTGSPPASTSASPQTANTGVEDLAVSASVRESLLSAFESFTGFSSTDITGTAPGSVYYAIDHSTGMHWALATFESSPNASEHVKVGLQDGGDIGMFKMPAGGSWSVGEAGEPAICGEIGYFPAPVLAAWNIKKDPQTQCGGNASAPDTAQQAEARVDAMSGPFGPWAVYKSFYDPSLALSAISALEKNGTGSSPMQVFFWHDGHYVGPALPPNYRDLHISSDVNDTVTVHYAHYKPNDPDCCPSQPDYIVRFQWNGTKVVALDPLPPAQQGQ